MRYTIVVKKGRVHCVQCGPWEIDDECTERGGAYLCHDETIEVCRETRDKDITGNAKWE